MSYDLKKSIAVGYDRMKAVWWDVEVGGVCFSKTIELEIGCEMHLPKNNWMFFMCKLKTEAISARVLADWFKM